MQMSRREEEERISVVETCNSASTLTSSHWRVVRAARSYLVVAAWQSSLLPAQSNNQLPWPGAGGSKYWGAPVFPSLPNTAQSTAQHCTAPQHRHN